MSYASEKMGKFIYFVMVNEGTLRERLTSGLSFIQSLRPEEFPIDGQQEFLSLAEIVQDITITDKSRLDKAVDLAMVLLDIAKNDAR